MVLESINDSFNLRLTMEMVCMAITSKELIDGLTTLEEAKAYLRDWDKLIEEQGLKLDKLKQILEE